jgi:hypothetical protein
MVMMSNRPNPLCTPPAAYISSVIKIMSATICAGNNKLEMELAKFGNLSGWTAKMIILKVKYESAIWKKTGHYPDSTNFQRRYTMSLMRTRYLALSEPD